MRTSVASAFAFCVLGCFATHDFAQEKPEVATIRDLESKWVGAYKQRQVSALASLLADDYVITMEDGSTYGKVGFVSYNAGQVRVEVAEMSDLKIRMHENVAVVTGAYHERGVSAGKPYDYHDRLTDVWMKIGGKWRLIVSHYSLAASV